MDTKTTLVNTCEDVCDKFEEIPINVFDIINQRKIYSKINITATIANIRIHYYISLLNYSHTITFDTKHAFKKLEFLLLDSQSKWDSFDNHTKATILYNNVDIMNHVLVLDI